MSTSRPAPMCIRLKWLRILRSVLDVGIEEKACTVGGVTLFESLRNKCQTPASISSRISSKLGLDNMLSQNQDNRAGSAAEKSVQSPDPARVSKVVSTQDAAEGDLATVAEEMGRGE